MIRRFYQILCFLVFCTVTSSAQITDHAYQFLNITSSAHTYALGGTNVSAVDDDVNTIGDNPALLGQEMHLQLGLNYMHYLSGANFAGARFAFRAHSRGALAIGVQYLSYGTFKRTDPSGIDLGTFSVSDVVIGATYSHDITDRIRGGVTLKFIPSSYESYSAFAIATDIGINYFNPNNDLSLSLVIKNLGGQVKKFDAISEHLPWDIQIGWSQYLRSVPIRFSITATNLNRWKMPYYAKSKGNDSTLELRDNFAGNLFRHLIFGAEYNNGKFYIGLAYNYKTSTDMASLSRNLLSGLSAGLGVNLHSFGFGVSYAQPHSGGNTIMMNLRCDFASLINRSSR